MSEQIQVGDQRIAVDARGEGPPVLLLHSSGMSSMQWRRLGSLLKADHRVLAPDFIGYGGSEPWKQAREVTARDDLAAVEAVALRENAPVHVIGHSYGGLVALLLASGGRVPVASVSVYDPVAFGVLYSEGDRAGIDQLESLDPGGMFAPRMAGTEAWMRLFVNYWGGPDYWEHLPASQQAMMMASALKTFQEVKSVSYDRTTLTEFARNKAPTLLITGSQSPLAARRVVALLANGLPDARLVEIDAGHMGPLTHGELVNAKIAEHIRSVNHRS